MASDVDRLPGHAVELDERQAAGLDDAPAGASLGHETNPELLPSREPLRTIMHAIGVAEQAIGTLLVVTILLLVLSLIVQRYIPNLGWLWTGELARYSMVLATFVMSGYLLAHDRHIAIHLVDFVLGARGLALVKTLVDLTVLVTCLLMMYATYDIIATDVGQLTAAAQIPLKWLHVPVLVGFALSAVRAALALLIADLPVVLHGEGGAK